GSTTDARGFAGEWVDAAPPEDYVIVNTGILLEHMTNGLIPIGWHRVVADADQPGERLSVVQFCHPTPSTVLAPAPSTVTADRPCRFSAVGAEDRLEQVIWEINMVGDARRVED
ncbi:MAG TPA: isopenicillin N synthase family oxygenase, partial [Acidimicrobiaceae bacterium]|nr:isopenicillin N synthase family oxygenase [Acidimicrobiaceae bacterium]